MAEERTRLLAVLTLAMAAGVSTLVLVHGHLIVAWWVVVVVIVPWTAISIFLRVRVKDYGQERPYLDLWSVPHFLGGVLLGMLGIELVLVAVIAALWEGVEVVSNVSEYKPNRVIDVALACAGWTLTNAIAGGSFALVP